MILLGNLYTLHQLQSSEDALQCAIILNPEHDIFRGHFPGTPVLPGACMMHMVKEVLEQKRNMPIQFQTVEQLKFLRIIDPRETPELKMSISFKTMPDHELITASLSKEEVVFFKMKATIET